VTNNWLIRALEESRARGFLGPGPIEPHISHALGFAACWDERFNAPPSAFLDLGSGGGLPALVLLDHWHLRGVLTDSMKKRANFLQEALDWDDAPSTGEVITGRIEDIARFPELVEAFDLVTARSFGPPSVTAECGVRFLRIGGLMVVSEPPDDEVTNRWSGPALLELGLEDRGRVRHGAAFQVLVKVKATPATFPRATGIPGKKPLF